jgi:ABC-type polysaccharide/polyol phosphate transport system ATPase subunit
MSVALRFENVVKEYAGRSGYRTLRSDLSALWRRRRSEDRVVALQNLNLELEVGESVGLVGRNGSGKTTALRLASRILYPTSGRVGTRGRVAGMMEVGTGLHPELTGLENIELFGRIMGLGKRGIAERRDAIVEFSELGDFVHQPVKHYSTGMLLRLGFSVAVHMDPDIVLVDEALSVGDQRFQLRCVEKLSDLKRSGATILLVSHDLAAVESVCPRTVVLRDGTIVDDGATDDVLARYVSEANREFIAAATSSVPQSDGLTVDVSLVDGDGRETTTIDARNPVTVRLAYRSPREHTGYFKLGVVHPRLGCVIEVAMQNTEPAPARLGRQGTVECRFPSLPLVPGLYELWGSISGEAAYGAILEWRRLHRFEVARPGEDWPIRSIGGPPVLVNHEWVTASTHELLARAKPD